MVSQFDDARVANGRTVLASCLRALLVVLLVMSLLFLYLMQRVKSREMDRDISLLKTEQAEAVKALNQLDAHIERLKSPERIVPLARELLGMRER
jgi:cell division protein FtsL